MLSLIAQARGQDAPIIVKLYEKPSDPTGLASVFLGVVRFAGIYVLLAILFGICIAAALFWFRSRSDQEPGAGD